MSDDTPTQRYPEGFPPPGGRPGEPGSEQTPHEPSPLADAPTERFDAAGTVPPAAGTVPPAGAAPAAGTVPPAASDDDGRRKQRGVIIGLAIAAGVLLLALIGVLIWLAVSAGSPAVTPTGSPTPSDTPSESPEPSPTPTETETTPPPPPEPENVISNFTASTEQVDCTGQGGGSVPLVFSWATTGVTLWFGIGTDDANANPYSTFPLNYTTSDADGIAYQCGQPGQQQRYTITVKRSDGTFQSQTIIIREV
jgi:hypothetical protein